MARVSLDVARDLRGSWKRSVGDRLRRRLEVAARRMQIAPAVVAPVALRIVGYEEMSRLHIELMGEPGPTDVISVPAASIPGGPIGDIAICWPWVDLQTANGRARDSLHEATILGIHGLMHLVGHDHRTSSQGARMHRAERRVLRAIAVSDVPRPYAR